MSLEVESAGSKTSGGAAHFEDDLKSSYRSWGLICGSD